MVSIREYGGHGPLVFMIHWLGGSACSWDEVGEQLAQHGFHGVGIDLPGFGLSSAMRDFSIPAMVCELTETIRSVRGRATDDVWFLTGHSMGGKLATIVAREAQRGVDGLENLRGLVLVSPSPPSPEPMDENKRQEVIQALGPGTDEVRNRRADAETFVDENTGKLPLLGTVRLRAVEDVLRMNPDALVAWMTTGSKEDWSKDIGVLDVPALILAGTEEQALGPAAQQAHTLHHFSAATLTSLRGGGHLAPLERPWEVADRMVEFFGWLGVMEEPAMLGAGFRALIESDRTSPQTRAAMVERMKEDRSDGSVLGSEGLRTLRSLAARVVPGARFDLASRMEISLAHKRHDGWRFHRLPEDCQAWRQGLASLDAAALSEFDVPFIALDRARQDDMLDRAIAGTLGRGMFGAMHLGESSQAFDAAQMRDWFEDVRGELVKLYVSDPRTMERIGFTGFADEAGFTKIRLGERDEVNL